MVLQLSLVSRRYCLRKLFEDASVYALQTIVAPLDIRLVIYIGSPTVTRPGISGAVNVDSKQL